MVELLSPVGDFECLKAAVQNGADCVYFGAESFNARNYATNFAIQELEEAIQYARIRNVKVNFVLNILIKEGEFEEAIKLARTVYNMGVNAVIVQDLGLISAIREQMPELPIHASTQMTTYSLEGVKELEKIGVERVVLSRELSISEIENITNNTGIQTEVFVHGALCMCYSGQCLFSSMVGGRSGNRGKCAQPCRLEYKLSNNGRRLREGYLLSPRDLCALDFIPRLVKAGVSCFKIEGRMKNPEYVATVTRIYRKYIDLFLSGKKYEVQEQDRLDLMQVFNRGGFSLGHLEDEPNGKLVYEEKNNNIGLYLGEISHYNENKGYIKIKLENSIAIGDRVTVNGYNYNISELLIHKTNTPDAKKGEIVVLGRIKGDIKVSAKVYKISSKKLQDKARDSYARENRRVTINCCLRARKGKEIEIEIIGGDGIYSNLRAKIMNELIPEEAVKSPTSKERIIEQLSKTGSTPYDFNFESLEVEDNIYVPSIAKINELRRKAIETVENYAKSMITKETREISLKTMDVNKNSGFNISVLLNKVNMEYDYSKLDAKTLYIPLKYFEDDRYTKIIAELRKKFELYIYMPTIYKENHIKDYNVNGFVVSHIGQIERLRRYGKPLIGNYTLNIYNRHTYQTLTNMGIERCTISPELDRRSAEKLLEHMDNSEMIVYGKIPLMTANYCLLSRNNKCINDCKQMCNGDTYIQDKLGYKFPIITNQGISTIYNCKTLSILHKDFSINTARIDILDENIGEINDIIKNVKNGSRCEGKEFTNGNMNRDI